MIGLFSEEILLIRKLFIFKVEHYCFEIVGMTRHPYGTLQFKREQATHIILHEMQIKNLNTI